MYLQQTSRRLITCRIGPSNGRMLMGDSVDEEEREASDGCSGSDDSKRFCRREFLLRDAKLLSEVDYGTEACDSSRGTSTSRNLDDKLWSSLPEEVMFLVLARLPARSFCRLRRVCKSWNNLPSDPRFRELCGLAGPQSPLCIMHDKKERAYGYHTGSLRWQQLSPSFFSLECSHRGLELLSTSGGLVLLRSRAYAERAFYVINPLTRSERLLPPMVEGRRSTADVHYAGMAMNRQTDDYKILIVEADVDEGTCYLSCFKVELYDSKSRSWESIGEVSRDELEGAKILSPVLHRGNFYCLIEHRHASYSICLVGQGHTASCYRKNGEYEYRNGQNPKWRLLGISLPDQGPMSATLFEQRGQLMFGGQSIQTDKSVHIWHVDLDTGSLTEKFRLPERFLTEFYASSMLASGDFVWITDTLVAELDRKVNITMCNIADQTWWTVPCNPFISFCHRRWHVLGSASDPKRGCLFLYEPRLDVLA